MKKRFIGRKNELNALQDKYNDPGFQMAVIYGRRRIGKTALINEFMNQNSCKKVSFVAVERSEKELLEMMGETVLSSLAPDLLGSVSFDSFDKLFEYVGNVAKKERVIFLIDEYPYLAKECSYINSLIQKFVDYDWKNTNLYFILCGSMVSFMKDEVLSIDAPLHARSTLEIKLEPFNYLETAKFIPNYSEEEKAIVYGLTSGVAKYIEQFNDSKSLDENIIEQFYRSTGYFTEEQIKTVVTGEKSNPTLSYEIISAVAHGHTKYNEICTAVHNKDIAYPMKQLVSSEILEKRVSTKPYYYLKDGMLKFWFTYVDRAASLINAGKGDLYYKNVVKEKLHEYMGPVFEEICKDYVYQNLGTKKVPFLTELKKYQASVKGSKKEIHQVELDLVGYNEKDIVLVGECKFRNQAFNKEDLENFLEKLEYIPTKNPKRMLFSLSGFNDYVKKHSEEITLVTIKEMY